MTLNRWGGFHAEGSRECQPLALCYLADMCFVCTWGCLQSESKSLQFDSFILKAILCAAIALLGRHMIGKDHHCTLVRGKQKEV